MKKTRTLLRALVPLVFCAASSITSAQSADGPFGSKDALTSYWAQNANSQATEIALNGFIVYNKIGVGPANVREYYVCANGLIRPFCDNVVGPFSNTQQIVDSVTNLVGSALLHTSSTLDGRAIPGLPAVPLGPRAGSFQYKTCSGDATAYTAPYRKPNHDYYVLVSGWAGGYGTFTGMDCLPRM